MSEPATVLVVDDNATKRYILSSWLRRAGHTVVETDGGESALSLLAGELRPDLVVLDIRMPDLDGFTVCERIKANPATASIPVIQVSAHAITSADRTEGLERGADAYMSEPIEPDEFAATVEATLRYFRARHRAELMAHRLGLLAETTLRINEADTFDRILDAAVAGTMAVLGRFTGALALPPDGTTRRVSARPGARPVAKTAPADLLTALSELSLGEATGTRMFDSAPRTWQRLLPDTAFTADVTGVLTRTRSGRPPVYLGVEAIPPLDQDESTLLRQLAQALALALDALRAYDEEHTIALTLQRSFLPASLPEVPGLRMCMRYLPAIDNVEVGGDFYEILPIGSKVLIAIGDVQGHSLHAATVMAELRHALRASVIGEVDLPASMSLLNEVLRRYHPRMTATVCLLLMDPRTGETDIANAGHIPPLLITDDGATYHRLGNLLLGAAHETYRLDHVVVPPGGAILLFTDGLIEDRQVPLDQSLEVARQLAQRVDGDLEAFCDRLIARFGPREDDVAIVMVHR